jgi:dimethylhistidine N-methyltransferase
MMPHSSPTFFSFPADAVAGLSEQSAVIAGLTAAVPWVSPKYLYGPLGSRLFDAITELPEYYPTRTERSLLEACRDSLAHAVGSDPTLIDLGAGNCDKARSLFHSLKPRQYVAVDMSVEFLRHSMSHLQRDFPQLEMLGIGIDFSAGLRLPDAVRRDNRLFFYPGSSIGNFTPDDAQAFLAGIRAQCAGGQGGLLIGVDLVKDASILQAAYDDALGVTAAFNLNLLNNLNALVGSDFAVGRAVAHRNAPGGETRHHGALDRRHTRLRPGAAHPHREQLQIRT